MAKMDLIKGIDNSCEAARRARRRAEANGVVWRAGPILKGIGNDGFEAGRVRALAKKSVGGSERVTSLSGGYRPSTLSRGPG